MKKIIIFYFLICLLYVFTFLVNTSRAEYLLVTGEFMFLGRSTKDGNLVTCYQKLIPIGSGRIIEVSTKCRDDGGIWAKPVGFNIDILLNESFKLIQKGEIAGPQKILEIVLKKDPGNPLALNNMASIMIKQKRFDKAETYLTQALPRSKDYKVQINLQRQEGMDIVFVAFKPDKRATDSQNLEPIIKMNLDMLKQYMSTKEE